MNRNLNMRKMTRCEIDTIIEWAEREGWNPGLHDADALFAADPNGHLIGFLGKEPIATISAIKYDDDFGFLGFHIIPPEHRGKGYSLQMTEFALEYLHGASVGIDGVESLKYKYESLGFLHGWANIRYVGFGKGREEKLKNRDLLLSDIDFQVLDDYDANTFGHRRSNFLRTWINQPEGLSIGVVSSGRLGGYGVLRKCKVGYKIGPLYADSNEIAFEIFETLVKSIPTDERVYIDVPNVNYVAISIVKGHGMKEAFRTIRMYSRRVPDVPLSKWFSITCQELG